MVRSRRRTSLLWSRASSKSKCAIGGDAQRIQLLPNHQLQGDGTSLQSALLLATALLLKRQPPSASFSKQQVEDASFASRETTAPPTAVTRSGASSAGGRDTGPDPAELTLIWLCSAWSVASSTVTVTPRRHLR
ncbi:Os04g0582200 [Oryza sativa Japonica Group]|uniref:Os04g0582200 protein n=1 Tax=Oryza sativa subsp. japonica TaxID=39947 RepID=A0A0P0WE96_ORYSJ|nr:Os04g0582200 [Oryza sativa Japonica Group]